MLWQYYEFPLFLFILVCPVIICPSDYSSINAVISGIKLTSCSQEFGWLTQCHPDIYLSSTSLMYLYVDIGKLPLSYTTPGTNVWDGDLLNSPQKNEKKFHHLCSFILLLVFVTIYASNHPIVFPSIDLYFYFSLRSICSEQKQCFSASEFVEDSSTLKLNTFSNLISSFASLAVAPPSHLFDYWNPPWDFLFLSFKLSTTHTNTKKSTRTQRHRHCAAVNTACLQKREIVFQVFLVKTRYWRHLGPHNVM